MDSHPSRPSGPGEHGYPFVAQAAHTKFSSDLVLDYPSVQSRAVVGCHAGRGTVILQGVEHPLHPGLLYLLPWEHSISYRPDPRDPFFVFGLHVIPWQRADRPVQFIAAHDRTDPLHGVDWRRPCPPGTQPPPAEVIVSSERERPGLAALARYAIERFLRGHPPPAEARSLGILAMSELDARSSIPPQEDPSLPADFRGMLVWIIGNLDRHITLADMAAVMECSASTVSRQFRRYLGCPPMEWVIDQRVERAQRMLASGNPTIASVARECGLDDPRYFTRLFKARVGSPPREWRRHRTI